MDSQDLWQMVLGDLEVSLSRANFGMWFKDTFIAEDSGEAIVIGVPNAFYLDWIRGKYHKNIAEALRKFRPTLREISYKVAAKTTAPPVELRGFVQESAAPSQPASRLPYPSLTTPTPANHTPLDEGRTFDNFIVGNSNRLAHAVSLAAAQEPGTKYNPLFIYGGVGLGKTHLAHAIGNEIQRQASGISITYVSCEVFTNEFIESIQKNQTESFKRRYRQTDVLLIDDIQFMSGKERTQEEFFHTFNALHQTKKQIVLTADREPQNIPELEDRLTSRFAWGMVADIQPPDFETRVAILQAKCQERGYTVSAENLSKIAELIQSNIRELEGALQRVIIQSQVERTELNPEFIGRILSGAVSGRNRLVNATRIIQAVSEFFELKIEEVVGERRYKEFVYPRQLIMYLLRHELSFSYPKIGKELGGKDHTTVMHGVEKIERELARNNTIQYDLTKLKERIYQAY